MTKCQLDPTIARTARLDGKVELISVDEAVGKLARATRQDQEKCREVLLYGCRFVTAGYEYQLHKE